MMRSRQHIGGTIVGPTFSSVRLTISSTATMAPGTAFRWRRLADAPRMRSRSTCGRRGAACTGGGPTT
eukprot:11168836-Lingulodinium_polyedra.AAC.1